MLYSEEQVRGGLRMKSKVGMPATIRRLGLKASRSGFYKWTSEAHERMLRTARLCLIRCAVIVNA